MDMKTPSRSHEVLWKEYFVDPSQWWDYHNSKVGHAFPDFKHKVTKESLWIDNWTNPSWVVEELRARGISIAPHARVVNLCESNGISSNEEATAFVALLRACAKDKDLHRGIRIHQDILKKGLLEKCSDGLAIMYARCGSPVKAQELLDMHESRNVFAWTALVVGYIQQGQAQDALDCFLQLQQDGLSPNAATFTSALKACAMIGAVGKGKEINDEIVRQGLLGDNLVLGTALVDMYVKCGALDKARCMLEELSSRDVVSWSALIAGYTQGGQGEQALECFEQMQGEGLSPNAVTFTCILNACGSMGAADKGAQIHEEIAKQGLLEKNIVLGNALIDMYAKCGFLEKAQEVLEELPSRNVVSWSSLISGHTEKGLGEQALDCYEQMQHEGLSPNAVTMACILKACALIRDMERGKQIHEEIARSGLLKSSPVLGIALVDMYAKCGALAKAEEVLKELSLRDVASWNALITGFVQVGQAQQALHYFEEMGREGLYPDLVTFGCVLKACGNTGAVDKGKRAHDEIVRLGLLPNLPLGTAVVDMYAKCGAFSNAQQVFKELPSRDVISWNTLIAGYSERGRGEQALACYEWMIAEGLCPDKATFACILKACVSIGAADRGEKVHDEIVRQGLLESEVVLGTALVDMYAKCGDLVKACGLLDELPCQDVTSWNAVLAGYAQKGEDGQAIDCFKWMRGRAVSPDAWTLSCLLNVCSHLGLVDEGERYFMDMSVRYGVRPGREHYTCMVDLFGRAGHFEKAVRVIQKIPFSHCLEVWLALLQSCRKWGEVDVARWAFGHAIQVEHGDDGAAAYVIMANIYAAAGMQELADIIEGMRMQRTLRGMVARV